MRFRACDDDHTVIQCVFMRRKICILMEYVSGGSIHSLLHDFGPFVEETARSCTKQILTGLHYMHEKGALHRDLKGANILVDANGVCKISDFGTSKLITGTLMLNIVIFR